MAALLVSPAPAPARRVGTGKVSIPILFACALSAQCAARGDPDPAAPAVPSSPAGVPAEDPSAAEPAPESPREETVTTFTVPKPVFFVSVEVSCPSGLRMRAPFSGGLATVVGLPPTEDCVAVFIGGVPAKASSIRGGRAYTCEPAGVGVVCR